MYIYLYVCTYVCMDLGMHVYTYAHMCVFMYMCVLFRNKHKQTREATARGDVNTCHPRVARPDSPHCSSTRHLDSRLFIYIVHLVPGDTAQGPSLFMFIFIIERVADLHAMVIRISRVFIIMIILSLAQTNKITASSCPCKYMSVFVAVH